MNNIINFRQKKSMEDILDMSEDTFEDLLTEYENHSKLASLITEYRNLKTHTDRDFHKAEMLANNTKREETFSPSSLMSAMELGRVKTQIAVIIESL